MAIFTRRQLQMMLNELGPWLAPSKVRDLINRLERTDPDQAVPAEYEMSLAWAITKLADLTFEPSVGAKAPDFLSNELFPAHAAIIEVAAISDDGLSGESAMERTANIISGFADSVRKRASNNLHYTFYETSGYRPAQRKAGQLWSTSEYFRRRLASRKFKLSPAHESQLRSWLKDWPPKHPLRISGEDTELSISWKEWVHPNSRVFSSMPSLTHSLTDNPVFRRLKEKERDQLRDVPPGTLRCIFLGDAGCRLLREPHTRDPTNRVVCGKDIIFHFLQDSTVDLVAIFSPRRRLENTGNLRDNPRLWHSYVFDLKERPAGFHDNVLRLHTLLPSPYLHGYQARSWLQQGMLSKDRGQYMPLIIGSGPNGVTARLSARALMDLIAGRITPEQFERSALGGKNLFELWLTKGYAIRDVTFESSGDDRDDDRIVFRLEPDPSSSPLKAPGTVQDQTPGGETTN
jgi:hypothetical protein